MHRFCVPTADLNRSDFVLCKAESHHALRVLRVAQGDRVMAMDGEGTTALCRVVDTAGQVARLEVIERRVHLRPEYEIALLQALPKGRMFEDIIEKATELGVTRVVPLLSERVVSRIPPEAVEGKLARWRQTVTEAMKQSGNPWPPKIDPPQTPAEYVARGEVFDLAVVGSLIDPPKHLKEHWHHFQETHGRRPGRVAVWIGPEGDFTPAEIALAKSAGALPISLGPIVLRCETAALYCLSVIRHELSAPTA